MKVQDIICILWDNQKCKVILETGKTYFIEATPSQFVQSFYFKKNFYTFKNHYKHPINIQNVYFQPTMSIKNKKCEFINVFKIIQIKKKGWGSLVYFKNFVLYLDLSPTLIYKYLNFNILFKIRINLLGDSI